jgi:hypothetical protein
MAAAEGETAEALRAEVAALRMRVQVWDRSRSRGSCLLSSLDFFDGLGDFYFLPQMLGWMWLGVGEGEPEAGQGCFELYLRIQGDALHFLLAAKIGADNGLERFCSLSLTDMQT